MTSIRRLTSYLFVFTLLLSCGSGKYKSPLRWVPANVNKIEVTNWKNLKQQFNINSEAEFFASENWSSGTYSSGFVWSMELGNCDLYKKLLGFSYPDVNTEIFVNVAAFEPLHIFEYNEEANIMPLKNYLDSGNYLINTYHGFTTAYFSGTADELEQKYELGISIYAKYSHIAFNEIERVVLFSKSKENIEASIIAHKQNKSILSNSDFNALFLEENKSYTYQLSNKPFLQTPSFSNSSLTRDYDYRLADYMGISENELRSMQKYKSYSHAFAIEEGKIIWNVDLVYDDAQKAKQDLAIRSKILSRGRSFSDRKRYNELFVHSTLSQSDNHLSFRFESDKSMADYFYKMVVMGDLGFMLCY